MEAKSRSIIYLKLGYKNLFFLIDESFHFWNFEEKREKKCADEPQEKKNYRVARKVPTVKKRPGLNFFLNSDGEINEKESRKKCNPIHRGYTVVITKLFTSEGKKNGLWYLKKS